MCLIGRTDKIIYRGRFAPKKNLFIIIYIAEKEEWFLRGEQKEEEEELTPGWTN